VASAMDSHLVNSVLALASDVPLLWERVDRLSERRNSLKQKGSVAMYEVGGKRDVRLIETQKCS